MVAFTPNRGYPYSEPTDRTDVAQAIEDLAEAIDLDMQSLDNTIIQRPFAKVSSRSSTNQVFPADQATECTFDFVDADTAGISNLTNFPTRLTPTSAGLWLLWGAIETPASQSRTRDLFLRVNGADLTRQNFHVNDPTGGPMTMSIAGMWVMNGTTDYFTMTFEPDGGLDDYRIRNKQMACFRLTDEF